MSRQAALIASTPLLTGAIPDIIEARKEGGAACDEAPPPPFGPADKSGSGGNGWLAAALLADGIIAAGGYPLCAGDISAPNFL